MTGQNEFVRHIVATIEQAGIPYMLVGSIASSFHGWPRATVDADIVIDPTPQQLAAFIESMERDYYISRQAVAAAIENRAIFNVIDAKSGWKADMIIRKNRAFSRQEFTRKILSPVFGTNMYLLTPEDALLSKLEWAKGRTSQVQFNDALGILTVQTNRLDFDYLRKWAKELDVAEALEKLITEANKLKTRNSPGGGL